MLTRLRVSGFKNLFDVDVRFGPFTCVAGPNGVGKSNLFDAITFLGALADQPLLDAACGIRDEKGRATDVRSLFFRVGDETVDQMSFEAEMLVPREGEDDLGQPAKAAITFLRYKLVLGLEPDQEARRADRLVVRTEELSHINVGEAHRRLPFEHSTKWRKSVAQGARRGGPFISTEDKGETRVVKLHQDGEAGRPRELVASKLPRTVLSSVNATENPTALLAKREMQSWRLLQLEPTALRNADPFNAPTHLGAEGAHLASTLFSLAGQRLGGNGRSPAQDAVYAQVANRLSELVGDVRSVTVDVDRQRELFTLQVKDARGTLHAARALSDGTLRFLALTILERDPHSQGLLCLEEPENGIHPERVPAMLDLLKDLTVDADEEVGLDNPLRQVIVNTHAPAVVGLVDDADLLVAVPAEIVLHQSRWDTVRFAWLEETWRHQASPDVLTVSRGHLRAYLNPLGADRRESEDTQTAMPRVSRRGRRQPVKDRPDLQRLLGFMGRIADD